jgi:hypothetical protein
MRIAVPQIAEFRGLLAALFSLIALVERRSIPMTTVGLVQNVASPTGNPDLCSPLDVWFSRSAFGHEIGGLW